MREPFSPQRIFAALEDIHSVGASLSDEARKYADYYHLDMTNQVAGVSHRFGFFRSGDYRIACHFYQADPCQGTVFLLHGYYDHVGLYRHIIRGLLEMGYNVVAYDQPGHGLSSGGQAQIDGFSEYTQCLQDCLNSLSEQITGPIALLGQSTGAAIIMDYLLFAQSPRCEIGNVVLLAPLHRPSNWRNNLTLYYVVRSFAKTIRRKFMPSSHDEEFLHFVREQDPLQSQKVTVSWVGSLHRWIQKTHQAQPCKLPITVIQGTGDETVAWQQNIEFIKDKFPNGKIVYLQQARHHLVNESPSIRQRVFEEIKIALTSVE